MTTITNKTIITLASVSSTIAAIVMNGVKEVRVGEKTVRVYPVTGEKKYSVISRKYVEELIMAMSNRVTVEGLMKDMDVVYGSKGVTVGIDAGVKLVKANGFIAASVMNVTKEVVVEEVIPTKEKKVRTYKRTKKDQARMDYLTSDYAKKEVKMDRKTEEAYLRQHSGFGSVEAYVTCNCCMNKVQDILPKVEVLKGKQEKIVGMFAKIGLVDELGYMKPVYGDNNADAFKIFNDRAYAHIVAVNQGKYIPKAVFTELVKANRKERMDVAYGLQKDYWTFKNEIADLWANIATAVVGDRVSDGFDTFDICPICGSADVQIVSNGRTWHLGIDKQTLKDEDYAYGFKDNMSNGIYLEDDYVMTSERDLDVYNWVNEDMADCAEYKYNCERDEAEDEFFTIAPYMPIEKACAKLGSKSSLIADIIAEYYSVKMSVAMEM